MIKMLLALVVALPISAATPVSAAAAEAADAPVGRVTVDVVSANGSGCPAGTTDVEVASDNSEFRIIHRGGYVARVGPGADPTDFRKNCQLILDIRVPSGFTFGIVRADYRGRVGLAAGARALQGASYYFQGDSNTVRRVHGFTGPLWDHWATTDTFDPGSVIFAPCDAHRYFNLNTELRVDEGTSNPQTTASWISMDSPDRNPNSRYRFIWKRC